MGEATWQALWSRYFAEEEDRLSAAGGAHFALPSSPLAPSRSVSQPGRSPNQAESVTTDDTEYSVQQMRTPSGPTRRAPAFHGSSVQNSPQLAGGSFDRHPSWTSFDGGRPSSRMSSSRTSSMLPIVGRIEWTVEKHRAPWWPGWVAQAESANSRASESGRRQKNRSLQLAKTINGSKQPVQAGNAAPVQARSAVEEQGPQEAGVKGLGMGDENVLDEIHAVDEHNTPMSDQPATFAPSEDRAAETSFHDAPQASADPESQQDEASSVAFSSTIDSATRRSLLTANVGPSSYDGYANLPDDDDASAAPSTTENQNPSRPFTQRSHSSLEGREADHDERDTFEMIPEPDDSMWTSERGPSQAPSTYTRPDQHHADSSELSDTISAGRLDASAPPRISPKASVSDWVQRTDSDSEHWRDPSIVSRNSVAYSERSKDDHHGFDADEDDGQFPPSDDIKDVMELWAEKAPRQPLAGPDEHTATSRELEGGGLQVSGQLDSSTSLSKLLSPIALGNTSGAFAGSAPQLGNLANRSLSRPAPLSINKTRDNGSSNSSEPSSSRSNSLNVPKSPGGFSNADYSASESGLEDFERALELLSPGASAGVPSPLLANLGTFGNGGKMTSRDSLAAARTLSTSVTPSPRWLSKKRSTISQGYDAAKGRPFSVPQPGTAAKSHDSARFAQAFQSSERLAAQTASPLLDQDATPQPPQTEWSQRQERQLSQDSQWDAADSYNYVGSSTRGESEQGDGDASEVETAQQRASSLVDPRMVPSNSQSTMTASNSLSSMASEQPMSRTSSQGSVIIHDSPSAASRRLSTYGVGQQSVRDSIMSEDRSSHQSSEPQETEDDEDDVPRRRGQRQETLNVAVINAAAGRPESWTAPQAAVGQSSAQPSFTKTPVQGIEEGLTFSMSGREMNTAASESQQSRTEPSTPPRARDYDLLDRGESDVISPESGSEPDYPSIPRMIRGQSFGASSIAPSSVARTPTGDEHEEDSAAGSEASPFTGGSSSARDSYDETAVVQNREGQEDATYTMPPASESHSMVGSLGHAQDAVRHEDEQSSSLDSENASSSRNGDLAPEEQASHSRDRTSLSASISNISRFENSNTPETPTFFFEQALHEDSRPTSYAPSKHLSGSQDDDRTTLPQSPSSGQATLETSNWNPRFARDDSSFDRRAIVPLALSGEPRRGSSLARSALSVSQDDDELGEAKESRSQEGLPLSATTDRPFPLRESTRQSTDVTKDLEAMLSSIDAFHHHEKDRSWSRSGSQVSSSDHGGSLLADEARSAPGSTRRAFTTLPDFNDDNDLEAMTFMTRDAVRQALMSQDALPFERAPPHSSTRSSITSSKSLSSASLGAHRRMSPASSPHGTPRFPQRSNSGDAFTSSVGGAGSFNGNGFPSPISGSARGSGGSPRLRFGTLPLSPRLWTDQSQSLHEGSTAKVEGLNGHAVGSGTMSSRDQTPDTAVDDDGEGRKWVESPLGTSGFSISADAEDA